MPSSTCCRRKARVRRGRGHVCGWQRRQTRRNAALDCRSRTPSRSASRLDAKKHLPKCSFSGNQGGAFCQHALANARMWPWTCGRLVKGLTCASIGAPGTAYPSRSPSNTQRQRERPPCSASVYDCNSPSLGEAIPSLGSGSNKTPVSGRAGLMRKALNRRRRLLMSTCSAISKYLNNGSKTLKEE